MCMCRDGGGASEKDFWVKTENVTQISSFSLGNPKVVVLAIRKKYLYNYIAIM